MNEALSSSETYVLTRAIRRNILEDAILHGHRRENLKSYKRLRVHITDIRDWDLIPMRRLPQWSVVSFLLSLSSRDTPWPGLKAALGQEIRTTTTVWRNKGACGRGRGGYE
jgi:hypothetical protein